MGRDQRSRLYASLTKACKYGIIICVRTTLSRSRGEGVDMTTVAIEEAQHSLPQLIDVVAHGEHVFITRDQVTVAELVPVNRAAPKPTFGSAEGLIKMSDDFDDYE